MPEKTEQPTPKKLRDARKKGQVASSKEVTSAVLMIAIFGFLWGMSDYYLRKMEEMILLPTGFLEDEFENALKLTLDGFFSLMIDMLVPLLALVIVVAIMANLFQFGILFALESIKPDLKKLNPAKGIKKIFSVKNLIEFIKSVIKIAFLSILLYFVISNSLKDVLKIPDCGLSCVTEISGELLKQIIINASLVFIVIAAFDFVFQKFQHLKQLKMSKDEIKREYKEMEGDPLIKSKRRHLHQELMNENMKQNVKRANVVVTNPTRIAIALEYRQGETALPVVRAKGQNLIAQRIIEIAKEEGIPIMENVPLARALNEQCTVDQYIPSDLIQAVAEVFRWVAQLEQNQF